MTVKTSVQLDIISEGHNVGNHFSMKKDWIEFFAGRRRGINIAIVDEVNGSVLHTETFDTPASESYSNKLAEKIEEVRPGRIVVAAVSNDSATNLNARAKRSLMSLGSEKINQIAYQGSWALIGIKGTPRGHGYEQLMNSAPVNISIQVKLEPYHRFGTEISVESCGQHSDKCATIKINGTAVDIPNDNGYSLGLHVVVVNQTSGAVIYRRVYDTSAEISIDSPSDHFANLIASQSNGTIVAIATKDEAIDNLSEQAKKACKSIGSVLIDQVRHGGSWAIVGKKGAAIGSVPEAASNDGSSKSSLFFGSPVTASTSNACSVAIISSGISGIKAQLAVNDIKSLSSLSAGITIAILCDGTIQRIETFTSSQSKDLIDFIKQIPPGRIVLGSIYSDGVQHMNDGGRAALEAIGSAIIRNVGQGQAWAIIGRKGAARGSVLEQSHQYSTAIAADVYFRSIKTPFVTVQSAGYVVGNYAHITLNGTKIVITNGHGRGLHVVVINGGSGTVTTARSFDTYGDSNASPNFVKLINSLSTGMFVAISGKDEITTQLSEQAIQAIEGLGSKYIRQIKSRGSWAILGRKGAEQGTVLEAASNVGPTEIVSAILPTTQLFDNKCKVLVESVGAQSLGEYRLIINNVKTSMQRRRGITLSVFEESRCVVERTVTYDTYITGQSSRLADFFASVPTGRIVVACVWDEAQSSLTEAAKVALESIGSALIRSITHRDAWAIVGRKGAAPGSVPESWAKSINFLSSTSVAVGGLMELKEYSCDVLYPLKCLTSGQQCINLQENTYHTIHSCRICAAYIHL